MTIRILHGDIHLIDLQTRLPFKYGIATMTRAPQAFVRLLVDVDGRESTGIAADLLPPKWFTKIADKPLEAEISEMLEVILHAVAYASGITGQTAFEVWQAVFEFQDRWGRERGYPSLLSGFGTTLVERALIEALCRIQQRSFGECLRANDFGIRLETFDQRLAGRSPNDLLPATPRRRIMARHTVGMADPLENSEIAEPARLHDRLPQSLAECIQRYGLRHFKLKLSGGSQQDINRLAQIATVIDRNVKDDFAFTLDGNESFRSLESFRDYWDSLSAAPQLGRFLEHAMFVEQPFHREMALDQSQLRELAKWNERPKLIIDESDADLDSLSRALALGYNGTSHKNCKGVFKGIANACLVEWLRHQPSGERLVMSGEDLANIGPVALLQDLAVVASLGVTSVERNGHHYFAGLSAFPLAVQEQILAHHGDLYERTARGWPSLRIVNGELSLDSIVNSPLGVAFELDVTQFTPIDRWNKSKFPQVQTQ
jgi:hypothetical protein